MNREPLPSLGSRLAWLIALRLALLSVLLGLVVVLPLRDVRLLGDFSGRLMLFVLAVAFAAAGIQAALLRKGQHLRAVAYSQIIADQITWTLLVYVTGGLVSGATSFYGLTCLTGAVVEGAQGVVVAAVLAALCLVALCVGLVSGLLQPPPDQLHSGYLVRWEDVSYPFLQSQLALVIVAVLTGYLAERLWRARGQLQAAVERAEKAEQFAMLGRFAAGLAHEIRNPLGSIAGSADLLSTAPGLSDEDRVLCGIITRETSRLNDLVTDMLDLARPRKPEISPVNVADVAQEVVRLSALSGRGIDVRVAFEGPAEPILLPADASQLRQVFWNLVRNAIQASSAGDTVHVRVKPGDANRVFLEVQDQGQGISEHARPQLFDAFFTTRSQGVGIGLAVVKRIVDDHGWSIEVVSNEGKGALFRVSASRPS